MNIQRTIAVTTLGLLASAMAIAKPAGPAKLGVTPESAANCPIPTLAALVAFSLLLVLRVLSLLELSVLFAAILVLLSSIGFITSQWRH